MCYLIDKHRKTKAGVYWFKDVSILFKMQIRIYYIQSQALLQVNISCIFEVNHLIVSRFFLSKERVDTYFVKNAQKAKQSSNMSKTKRIEFAIFAMIFWTIHLGHFLGQNIVWLLIRIIFQTRFQTRFHIWISDFKSIFDPDLNFLWNPNLKLIQIRFSNPD